MGRIIVIIINIYAIYLGFAWGGMAGASWSNGKHDRWADPIIDAYTHTVTIYWNEDMTDFYNHINLQNPITFAQIQRALLGNLAEFTTITQIAFFLGITVEELINPKISVAIKTVIIWLAVVCVNYG